VPGVTSQAAGASRGAGCQMAAPSDYVEGMLLPPPSLLALALPSATEALITCQWACAAGEAIAGSPSTAATRRMICMPAPRPETTVSRCRRAASPAALLTGIPLPRDDIAIL
jgi:hypothetical protein